MNASSFFVITNKYFSLFTHSSRLFYSTIRARLCLDFAGGSGSNYEFYTSISQYWNNGSMQNIMLLHKYFDPIVATYDILWCGNIMNVTQSGSAICFSTFFLQLISLLLTIQKMSMILNILYSLRM